VADQPDGIVLRRHRDLDGRLRAPWIRRVLLVVLAVVPVLGLLNVFGQRPSTSRADAVPASLAVSVPSALRGGLLFQARFTIEAKDSLKDATLVLNRSWLDNLTINTIEPGPVSEASQNGRLSLELGHIPAGMRYVLYMEFQVNPTTVGRRTLHAELQDSGQTITTITRDLTIYP
jgi:hypothetical protein